MCSECLKIPCAERCPNAEYIEPVANCWCSICHREIFPGEDYYSLPDGKAICPDCMDGLYIESEL